MSDSAPLLEETAIFQGLSLEEIASLRERVHPRSFVAGDLLLEVGQHPDGLFVIESGLVTVSAPDGADSERELATLGKGECLGEIALVTGEPCSASVRAVAPTETWMLPAAEFVEVIEHYPGLWRNLGRILSQRLVRTSRHLTRKQYATAVTVIVTDYLDVEVDALAPAVVAALRRQSGRRALLIDGRARVERPFSGMYASARAPTLSALLGDRSLLKRHEDGGPADDILSGARISSISAESERELTEEELLTVLDWLRPIYDHVLFLTRPNPDEWSPLLLERARSTLAILSDRGIEAIPGWLDVLIGMPQSRDRLTVAMAIGQLSASPVLDAIEERTGRAVTRLRVGSNSLRELSERRLEGWANQDREFRDSAERLARGIAGLEVGLALGAGAAKGFAHIGVIKVLEEYNVPVDYVAGCSIGAIVGAAYAGGLTLEEIEAQLQGADRKIKRWTLPFRSLWSDAGLKEVLRDQGPKVRFRDLRVPFAAVATDISSGREVVVRKGLVWRGVQASVSVPGIFPPALVFHRALVDGGLVNPVPSQTARDMGADMVIGVDLMSRAARMHENSGLPDGSGSTPLARIPNLVEMLWRSTEIMQEEVTIRSAATADVTIEPKLGRVRWSDFSHRGREFIAAGEEAAREKLPELRRLLPFLGNA